MKHTYKHTKPQPSWLLQGLMIRAGLYDPLPPVAKSHAVPHEMPLITRQLGKSWLQRAWAKAKAAFVYDPART
ncbi:DNA primase [Curvibacter phage P26059B]|uniref:DNA primase n=1 Tax=Curvibacter phage P26059B TaxID=1983784 RepID=A0A384V7Q2_9CAUD|nr:DNA primase [Curvibacter phage P26059B]ASJ79308.1 DNA primase [Curvibacter phage P26059B]